MNINIMIINHNFFEVQIKNNVNKNIYRIFYTKYKYTNRINTKYNGNYYKYCPNDRQSRSIWII
jgi:hypothetical protein